MPSSDEYPLNDLSWLELLAQLKVILEAESWRLSRNKAHYFNLVKNVPQNRDLIERTKKKLEHEQLRNAMISELINRVETHNILIYLNAIDFCFESERKRGVVSPNNYQIMIVKRDNYFQIYYYPL